MTDKTENPVVIPEGIRRLMELEKIFMPYTTRQRNKLYADGKNHARFVHYTSAEAALSIIKSKRIWMRNTTCMSDYREVQHGFEIFFKFFSDEAKGKAFIESLDVCVPGAAIEAINLFNQWWAPGRTSMRFNIYIASFSEHDSEEDLQGRLSMWRAFGSNVPRVAIIFNVPRYSGGALALNTTFSPVAYLKEAEVHEELYSVIENVRRSCDFLRSVDRSLVVGSVVSMLVAGIACLKHEGFQEEREWRAIYMPSRLPSLFVESSIETIGGVPQTVYKFPLDETVSADLRELDLSRIFDRMIIGPSSYPWVMHEAFVQALSKAGITDAENRVFISDIPIRG